MGRLYILLMIHILGLDKVICGITQNGVTIVSDDDDEPIFNSKSYQKWENGQCVEIISVSGKGVKDELAGPCSVDTPGTFATDKFVMVGDPRKHSLCVYRDQKSNAVLTIVRNSGCTVRYYTTTEAITTYTEYPTNEATCTALKEKMIDELEKNRIYWENWEINFEKKMGNKNSKSPPQPPQSPSPSTPLSPQPVSELMPSGYVSSQTPIYNTQNGNGEDVARSTLTVTSRILQTPGPCKQEISAVGNGVKDTFIEPCTQNAPDSINKDGVTVFGDPNKLPFCLFSEKRGTLIVVKNKVCTTKTYKINNGVTTSTRAPMSIAKCSQIRKRMSEALKSKSNNGQQQPSYPVLQPQPPQSPVPSIVPAIPYMSQLQFYPMSPQSPMAPMLPQPLTPPVVAAPMPPPVNNIGATDSTTSPTVTYRSASNLVNSPKFSRTSNNKNQRGKITREFIIEGRGVNDRFKDCFQDFPNSMTLNNIFALRDINGDFGLFTDTWSELWVFQKDKCSRRTYETANGQTKITSIPVSTAECSTVKDKLLKHVGGSVHNLGGRQHNVNWNNNQDMNGNNQNNDQEREKDFDRKMAKWEKFNRKMAKF